MADKRYLTDRTLRALAPARATKRYEIWDTKLPGFGVRVGDERDAGRPGKAGRIAFILYARYPNSPKSPTRRVLGQYGPLTLEQARDKADEWRKLIGKGIDPAAAEEDARHAKLREQQEEQDRTFAAVGEKFIEHVKRNKERKAPEVERDLRSEFIKPWGARPIASITARDIATVIDRTVRRGKLARAHNLFGHIRRMFRWAVPLHVEHSPCALLSPKHLIGERARRDRMLTDDELRALWRATARMGYPFGPLYRLLLLSALRLSEACEARWSEIDLKNRTWVIPSTRMKKTGREAKPHLVPLTDAMLQVIAALPRFEGRDFLFSAGKTPLKATHFSKPKRRLDRRMLRTLRALARKNGGNPTRVTLPEWDNHDLRRVVRSHLSALRIPEEVREAVLAHARPGIKAAYDLYSYADEKREALTMWAARLRSIVEPSPVNVVEMTKAARG
jgi:integrase